MSEKRSKLDRMLYVQDTYPSLCAIGAIVLDVLYFVLIYKINKEFFYNATIGVSVISHLLFMLIAFLCSEEVKNYHSKYGLVMVGLAVVQIVRIFIFPLKASQATQMVNDILTPVMSQAQFTTCVIYLVGSAIFLVVGGLLSVKNTKTLTDYKKSLNK